MSLKNLKKQPATEKNNLIKIRNSSNNLIVLILSIAVLPNGVGK